MAGIFSKIINLFKKLKNPPFFLYHLFHYLNIFLPKAAAQRICEKNQMIPEQEFWVDTYDGSNQFVHPDMTYYKNKYWLVVTPYPYGMEEYENPCIYVADNSLDFKTFGQNPIAIPVRHWFGWHLSDPCIAGTGECLYCFYRETVKTKYGCKNRIWEKHLTGGGYNWSGKNEIMSSSTDLLLSPAFVSTGDGHFHMYYVNSERELVYCEFDKDWKQLCSFKSACKNMLPGYSIWHIAVVFEQNFDKMLKGSGPLLGLFLIRRNEEFKLFQAWCPNITGLWELREEIIPVGEKCDWKFLYKSCFVPIQGNILCSYVDYKNRYRAVVL